MFRNKKGVYGYIDKKKIIEAVFTVILFGIVLSIFLIGYFTTHTRANLMTIAAVLGTLPAGKKAVDFIIVLKYKTFEKKSYEKCLQHEGKLTCAYDMIISSYNGLMPLNAVAISGNTVVGYTSAQIDDQKLSNHIKEILLNNNYNKVSVKVYQKLDVYLNRLDEMNKHLNSAEIHKDEQEKNIKSVILAISI
ncbi:hypothetical protein [Anaerosacchariphilus polymeriproducens]|uniref:Uncharacterized protein n=1 Tax=Anaerosacchariphilus polymeriproducens TaxID=1812858 RepID=A0A371ATY8_9FIRM|nr:hypothetical protein [Anaerosacchariphilus polymeriproducens]RDU23025.1 hypothetical protein DWV06_11715 [Anaerosacchariphilus polymeriproducens]